MFIDSLRPSAARLALALVSALGLAMRTPLVAQVALGSGTYTQNFDAIASGLPTGWTIYTGANATSLGTAATLTAAATSWANTSGAWKNCASATGMTAAEADATQAAAANRALSIRQTGSFGDPGASANFYFSTVGQQVTSISFSAQILSVQSRSTTWSLQYGLGATPASWTTIATFPDPAAFGSTTVTASGFGTALDNQSNVWLRVVALAASTGSGSRDTFGIDDFTIITVLGGGGTPPSITTPPASQTVTEGGNVTFSVAATGDAPLSYQWRKGGSPLSDGGNISGATTDTLTLTGIVLGDAGSYDVIVTNPVSSVTSASATLTVNPAVIPPSITTQPDPQAVPAGGTATFSVMASGTTPLTYQWRKGGSPLSDGGNISGATTATLTITNVSAADAANYDVVVTNSADSATSNSVALTLGALITPSGQISYAGGAYVQGFDTLPSGGTFTLTGAGPFAFTAAPINATDLGGWSFAKYAGSGANALFRVDAGTGTSGSVYSYGSASASDRALGSLSSGSTVSRFGVTLVNNTGLTITQFALSYTGEQWRRGTGSANKLTFEYALDPANLNTGTFVAAPALDFTAPVIAGSGVALDGNAPANRIAISGTVTGLNWAPGQTLVLRWTDIDDGGSDDGLAIDDLTFNTPVDPGSILPDVAFTSPANGAINVATNSAVSVTFNEAVNATAASFVLNGSTSGVHTFALSGGPTSYTLTPDTAFAEGEVVTLTVPAAEVTDAATGTKHPGADYTASFITFSNAPFPIHTIQGSGSTSAFAGYSVTVQGVVVASFQGAGQIGGYYIEAPDADQDGNPATSEGIYVFDNANSVTVGDFVTVTGTVNEFGTAPNTETEISALTNFTKDSTGNALPTAVSVSLPFAGTGYAERYEGMRVTFPQTLTATDNYDLGHFGEVILSNGRLLTPTNIVAPGAPAVAQEAANLLNQVLLDDGTSATYPDPTPYLVNTGSPSTATLRAGSTTTGATGIISNRFGAYVIEPTATPTFTDANPRPAAPALGGSLRIAIGNVLNFFNGDGAGGGFPTARGATTFDEYQRQRAKIVAGILQLAPDIMGLTEVENDGYGPTSALADLVSSLNAAAPAGTTYAYVDASAVDIVTDLIHSAFIYRTETVEMVGAPAMLNNVYFNNHARNPLAQTFREKATGAKLTVSINHFRAKGSASSMDDGTGLNNDQNDGQGTNNYIRTKEAQALTAWLATDPTGSGDPDFLIIGDLNSYAKEDPITAIKSAGYVNLSEQYEGDGGWSYSFNGEFGHLDHALANSSLAAQIAGAATWHANADEPIYYDYNTENKSAAQQAINLGTPYRYSDHDPVVVGLNLTAAPAITAALDPQTVTVGDSVTFHVTAIGAPAPTYQWRRNGMAIPGATSATYTITHVTTANAGNYDVVVTNSAGSVTSNVAVLTVNPAPATVALSGLVSSYDGRPHAVTASTTPGGLNVVITYNGSTTPPANPGSYAVVAVINDPDYTGTASGTEVITITGLVRHAPTLNGGVHGSLQILSPESITLNGGAWVSGDLLVTGQPAVRLNGHPTYDGTVDGTGLATPANYTITLNGGATLRHVVRRTDVIDLPTVTAPPAPAGTRDVTLNSAGQSAGDFTTLRNLTLNGNAGSVAVPAGTYGTFTANGGSSFVLGTADAGTPSVYNFQGLTLNGNSRLIIVGPVTVNLAGGLTIDGAVGAADHPEWLQLNVASGGLTLNGGGSFDGYVTAPAGTVMLNGNSTLQGQVAADRLTINGNGGLFEPEE
jgi:predicted extracellular nuclease